MKTGNTEDGKDLQWSIVTCYHIHWHILIDMDNARNKKVQIKVKLTVDHFCVNKHTKCWATMVGIFFRKKLTFSNSLLGSFFEKTISAPLRSAVVANFPVWPVRSTVTPMVGEITIFELVLTTQLILHCAIKIKCKLNRRKASIKIPADHQYYMHIWTFTFKLFKAIKQLRWTTPMKNKYCDKDWPCSNPSVASIMKELQLFQGTKREMPWGNIAFTRRVLYDLFLNEVRQGVEVTYCIETLHPILTKQINNISQIFKYRGILVFL